MNGLKVLAIFRRGAGLESRNSRKILKRATSDAPGAQSDMKRLSREEVRP